MIRQAECSDIPIIEDILLDAVNYLRQAHLENQWNETNIKWDHLCSSYKIENFYIACDNNIPVGCMALTDYDEKYWPEIEKGKSLYLHKLAVKRKFLGKGFSNELINFAKQLAFSKGVNALRLDCNYHRKRLRKFYEDAGFVYVKKMCIDETNNMALYAMYK